MAKEKPHAGVVGFGEFGRFMSSHLARDFDLHVYDRRDVSAAAAATGAQTVSSLEAITDFSTVILAVPVQRLRPVLETLAPRLKPGTLVVDTCSVKVGPLAWMLELLPESVDVVGTHPMFGPQSGRAGVKGLKVVLCEGRGGREKSVRSYLEDKHELEVIPRAPSDHDREMAYIQGLTHWMAKALREIKMPDLELSTVAYRHMMKIEEILREDSDELFLTIAGHNPYAREARDELVARLLEIDSWVRKEGPEPSGGAD